jgi:exosortase/archaeosortase family protein
MLSLFFGEFGRLTGPRRGWLVVAGFALAFLFNVGRTLLLVWVVARDGLPALARWHDPAGVTILVACFLGLWGLSVPLRPHGALPVAPAPQCDPPSAPGPARLWGALVGLAIWLVCVEVGVELWYRARERGLPEPVTWGVAWPHDNATFREIVLPDATRQYLRFDEARDGGWREPDGTVWQMIYLRWKPGRVAPHLAKNHTPDFCLTASGRKLLSASATRPIQVRGLQLPFRSYVVAQGGAPVHVFYCLWEDRAPGATFSPDILSFHSRLRATLEGRRNLGQRSLEVVIWGLDNPAQAETALRRQLEKLLYLGEPAPGPPTGRAPVASSNRPA